jgi:hypothetical protein
MNGKYEIASIRCIDCVHCRVRDFLLDAICAITNRRCLAERFQFGQERCGFAAVNFTA